MHKIIGITGGIGSGKTIIANFINQLGYPVYNSDISSKKLVNEDENIKKQIINLLGKDSYKENIYNIKYVSSKIFGNDKLREELNLIIHPAVSKHFKDWCYKQTSKIIFRETALLFELKLNLQCYKSILITADENIRIDRVMRRDSRTFQEVKNIINSQMPENEKIKFADFVIENNTNTNDFKHEVKKILMKIDPNFEKII